jgi:hypothetical protein
MHITLISPGEFVQGVTTTNSKYYVHYAAEKEFVGYYLFSTIAKRVQIGHPSMIASWVFTKNPFTEQYVYLRCKHKTMNFCVLVSTEELPDPSRMRKPAVAHEDDFDKAFEVYNQRVLGP